MNEKIITELNKPLDESRIKYRKAFDGGEHKVPYLEGHDIISKANELFKYEWQFDLENIQIEKWRAVVLDRKTNQEKEVDKGIVYVNGCVSACEQRHSDIGRCAFTGMEQLDTALAGAATDCMKRCFRQFGEQFGNTLYDKDVVADLDNPKSVVESAKAQGGVVVKESLPRPYTPEQVKLAVKNAAEKFPNTILSEAQDTLLIAMLSQMAHGVDEKRHEVCKYLTGFSSVKEIPANYRKALLDWAKAEKLSDGTYLPFDMAVKEFEAIYIQSQKDKGQGAIL
jgi:hypothetical protein